jgi:hypothetical protein
LTFADTGKWQVQFIASKGTRFDTVTKTITIHPVFEKEFLGADTFYCQDEQANFTLKTPSNMHCIHWMGDHSYGQVDTFKVDTAGIYFVKVTDKRFCTVYDTIFIESVPKPSKPKILRSDDTLRCIDSAASYTWYHNGEKIQGSITNMHILLENGSYSVIITNSQGCTALSEAFLVDNIGINTPESIGLKIYPNPAQDYIVIQKKHASISIENVMVRDLQGRLVIQIKPVAHAEPLILNTTNLESGAYILELIVEERKYSRTIILHKSN